MAASTEHQRYNPEGRGPEPGSGSESDDVNPDGKGIGQPSWFPPAERHWLDRKTKSQEFAEKYDRKFGENIVALKAEGLSDAYPFGYVQKMIKLLDNQRYQQKKNKAKDSGQAAPLIKGLQRTRSAKDVFSDSKRADLNQQVNADRHKDGLSHQHHLLMLNKRLHDGWEVAPEDVRKQCEEIARQENQAADEASIYVNQQELSSFLTGVINSLSGLGKRQVGNLIFHGMGAYRDEDEMLQFFTVDSAGVGKEILQPFGQHAFYAAFHNHFKAYAEPLVPWFPQFDPELVTPRDKRQMMFDHVYAHWVQVFGDIALDWDAVTTNPTDYLVSPPSSFMFAEPYSIPQEQLDPAIVYFQSTPSLFKHPTVPEREGGNDELTGDAQELADRRRKRPGRPKKVDGQNQPAPTVGNHVQRAGDIEDGTDGPGVPLTAPEVNGIPTPQDPATGATESKQKGRKKGKSAAKVRKVPGVPAAEKGGMEPPAKHKKANNRAVSNICSQVRNEVPVQEVQAEVGLNAHNGAHEEAPVRLVQAHQVPEQPVLRQSNRRQMEIVEATPPEEEEPGPPVVASGKG
ncbi:hypothetical protein V5O48_013158 [Marasmius crinis-equi]|uniref:Uncharacterized protein n=1 Tax=Marasmius crinis-equi TaxID=585013 RepID=A0ABR3F0V6_9AGAR